MAEIVMRSERVTKLAEAKETYLKNAIAEIQKRRSSEDERPVGFWEMISSVFSGPRPVSFEDTMRIVDFEVEGELRRDLSRLISLKGMALEAERITITDQDYELLI